MPLVGSVLERVGGASVGEGVIVAPPLSKKGSLPTDSH